MILLFQGEGVHKKMFHKAGCTLIIYINCYFTLCRIYYFTILHRKAVGRRCFVKKVVLGNFTKFTVKHLCQSLLFNKVAGLRPEALAQVFYCEFCEISQNTAFYRTPPVAASVHIINCTLWSSPDFLKKISFCKAISYCFVLNMLFFSEFLLMFLITLKCFKIYF